MSLSATVFASPLQNSLERLSDVYGTLLNACRQNIRHDLEDAPAAEKLLGYFERGKMIRPMLTFLSASAVGGSASAAIHAAEALELLHVAALIHDDIMDGAAERRGLTTLHKDVGEPAALIIGDYLILRSFEVLAQPTEGESAACILSALRLLSHHAQECCRGQIREIERPTNISAEQHYYAIVREKTASQFVAAVTIGATLGKAGIVEFKALRRYAVNSGIAFQIRDDELDITGDSVLLGKPVGNSIASGRPLLPIIYLEKHGSPAALSRYREMRRDGSDRASLIELLEQEGALEKTRRVQCCFLKNALSSLEQLPHSQARDALSELGKYSIHRDC